MPIINIDDILKQVGDQIATLAETTASNYKTQAIAAGQQILSDMTADVTRWTQMLANGTLSTDEFELLAQSYEVEAAVAGLEQAGLAEVRAYQFGMSVLNTIINTVLKYLQTAGINLMQPKAN